MAYAKTISSEKTWTSDDGKVSKYKIDLDMDGKTIVTETFSNKIGQVGFQGEVMKYQRKNGEWAVKQPPRDGSANRSSRGNDPESMYRTSALKNATEFAYSAGMTADKIPELATTFYEWLTSPNKKDVVEEVKQTMDVLPTDDQVDSVSLDGIPF